MQLSAPRNHSQSPRTVGVVDAERLHLALRYALVRFDIEKPLEIHPHCEICEPSADTAVPIKEHVGSLADLHLWPKVTAAKPRGLAALVAMPSPECRLVR